MFDLMSFIFFLCIVSLQTAIQIRSVDSNGLTEDQSGVWVPKSISKLNQLQKLSLLNTHNKMRRDAKANEMYKLQWNHELENRAQQWTNKCVFESEPEKSQIPTNVGKIFNQNIHVVFTSKMPNLKRVVGDWFAEVQFYNFNYNNCSSSRCDNYKRMMWSNYCVIGCAMTKCKEVTGTTQAKTAYLLACNYGPGIPNELFTKKRPFVPGYGSECFHCARRGETCLDGGMLCSSKHCIASSLCMDKENTCEFWASRGFCQSYKQMMKNYCEKTCHFC